MICERGRQMGSAFLGFKVEGNYRQSEVKRGSDISTAFSISIIKLNRSFFSNWIQ